MERRKGAHLRTALEIMGGIVAAAAVFVAVMQYDYTKRKDVSDAAKATSEKEHSALVEAVKAETEARNDGDGKLEEALAKLVDSQTQETKAVTTLVTEMRFILKKTGLDGVGE